MQLSVVSSFAPGEYPCHNRYMRTTSSLAIVTVLVALTRDCPAQVPDKASLRQAGIRCLQSRHLTLYTDLPTSNVVDELPQVFDLAIPQWADFFSVDLDQLQDWHVTACIMRDSQRFSNYRLLPSDLPKFLHGIQRGNRIWVREQETNYYRRHLLLHEGTHAVMNRVYGRVGPVWYREGIADLLATHSFHDGKLRLNLFPDNRKQLENSGRIHLLREQVAKGDVKQIAQIVDLPTRAFLQVDSYAWCWALQSFLHRQPKYQSLCKSLVSEMSFSDRGVTEAFLRGYQRQRAELDYEWNLFVQHLDYGYDPSQETVSFADQVEELADQRIYTFQVDAAKAWQAAGLRIPPHGQIDIAAKGQFRIVEETSTDNPRKQPVAWMCEPQGVTIEYYQGRPLGQLLAAIVPENAKAVDSRFDPQGVGRRGQLSTKSGGQLYFRVNERSDKLGDNVGQITVKVRQARPR